MRYKNFLLSVLVITLFFITGYYLIIKNQPRKTTIQNVNEIQKPETIYLENSEQSTSKDKIALTNISKDEYLKKEGEVISKEETIDSLSESRLISMYPKIKRLNKECINLSLLNGVKKDLCNTGSEADRVEYTFMKYVPDFGYWFFVGYYEGCSGLLIDENTGDEIVTFCTKPIVSPDQKYLLTTSSDVFANFNYNGFQVLEKHDSKILIKSELIIENQKTNIFFGVSSPIWVDNNSFYFIKEEVSNDPNSQSGTDEDYGRFTF